MNIWIVNWWSSFGEFVNSELFLTKDSLFLRNEMKATQRWVLDKVRIDFGSFNYLLIWNIFLRRISNYLLERSFFLNTYVQYLTIKKVVKSKWVERMVYFSQLPTVNWDLNSFLKLGGQVVMRRAATARRRLLFYLRPCSSWDKKLSLNSNFLDDSIPQKTNCNWWIMINEQKTLGLWPDLTKN